MCRSSHNGCREGSQPPSPKSAVFGHKETRRGYGKSGSAPDARDRRQPRPKAESNRPRMGQQVSHSMGERIWLHTVSNHNPHEHTTMTPPTVKTLQAMWLGATRSLC